MEISLGYGVNNGNRAEIEGAWGCNRRNMMATDQKRSFLVASTSTNIGSCGNSQLPLPMTMQREIRHEMMLARRSHPSELLSAPR